MHAASQPAVSNPQPHDMSPEKSLAASQWTPLCMRLRGQGLTGSKSPSSDCVLLQVLWAMCVYLEALSVLPQLRMMQQAKVVEKFTAHYVFALGVARFISCAHWLLQIIDGNSFLLKAIGSGLWPAMVLLSEVVQTGILADFW